MPRQQKRNREEFFPLERAASAYQARLEKLQQLKPQLDADAYADALRREEAAYRETVRAIEDASEAGRKRSAVQSENARLTAEAESLRRRNDPDYEAQARYNDALERANVLLQKVKDRPLKPIVSRLSAPRRNWLRSGTARMRPPALVQAEGKAI